MSQQTTKEKDKDKRITLDPKTEAVLIKKGYVIDTKISEGAFGRVYTARNFKKDIECAVKVMDLTKCSEKFLDKFLPRELDILTQVDHPNVIVIFDIFRLNYKMFIFMELAKFGTVAEYIKSKGPLEELRAKKIFCQVADALYYLHSEKGIAHRDMKIENILFGKDAVRDVLICKLTDFGFARSVIDKQGSLNYSETFCGTEPYYAPEIIEREAYNSFLADVWAFGVVLFTMLNRNFPFHHKEVKVMLKEQKAKMYRWRPGLESTLSPELRDLISRMLEPDVKKRFNMDMVQKHRWVKKRQNIENIEL